MFLEEKDTGSSGGKLSGQKLVIAVGVLLFVVFGGIYFYYSSSALNFGSSEEQQEKPTIIGVIEQWVVVGDGIAIGKIRLENDIVQEVAFQFNENTQINFGYFDDRYKKEKDRGMDQGSLGQIGVGDYVEIYLGGDNGRIVTRFNYLR